MIIVFFFPSLSINYLHSPNPLYLLASFDCMEKDFQVSDKMRAWSGEEWERQPCLHSLGTELEDGLQRQQGKGERLWEGPVCLLDQPFIGETSSLAPTSCRLSLQCPGTWHAAFHSHAYFSALLSLFIQIPLPISHFSLSYV